MKRILAGLVLLGWVAGASADVGWNNSYVYVWPGAGPDVWYDLNGSDQGQNFHGADLGTFQLTSELYLNSQLNAWSDGADYYTDTSFALYYRVFATGDTPPDYSNSRSTSITDMGSNNWQAYTPGVNILQGLGAGEYSVHLFAWKIHYFDSGAQSWQERIFQGGENDQPFVAEFQVVPEPGTLALLGLGLAAMAGFRRRRA
jgi:hypothetical protein